MIVYEKISCSRTQSSHYIESFMWFLKSVTPIYGGKIMYIADKSFRKLYEIRRMGIFVVSLIIL
jgi:hypothetical protein